MCATMIRAQALPFIMIEVFFIALYLSDVSWKKRMKFIGMILCVTIVFLVPLWIRNWLTFHEFWLLTQGEIVQ